MNTFSGTLLYMAPEMFKQKYDNTVDNWAIGVNMYVLLSG